MDSRSFTKDSSFLRNLSWIYFNMTKKSFPQARCETRLILVTYAQLVEKKILFINTLLIWLSTGCAQKEILLFLFWVIHKRWWRQKSRNTTEFSKLSTGEKNKINMMISTACWLLITLLFKVWKEQKKSQAKRSKRWTISAILWISQKVSQVLIYSQVTMLDDFSEKNDFNYDVKCVSITK